MRASRAERPGGSSRWGDSLVSGFKGKKKPSIANLPFVSFVSLYHLCSIRIAGRRESISRDVSRKVSCLLFRGLLTLGVSVVVVSGEE